MPILSLKACLWGFGETDSTDYMLSDVFTLWPDKYKYLYDRKECVLTVRLRYIRDGCVYNKAILWDLLIQWSCDWNPLGEHEIRHFSSFQVKCGREKPLIPDSYRPTVQFGTRENGQCACVPNPETRACVYTAALTSFCASRSSLNFSLFIIENTDKEFPLLWEMLCLNLLIEKKVHLQKN